MALRIGWGAQKIFVISVGGFHPAFHEVPSDLSGMKRMTIALLSGQNPRLTAQTYFAITSNTVQSGARVELYAAAGGFNIYGFLGYDLLVQFLPLHFVADIEAGLALREGERRYRRGARVLRAVRSHAVARARAKRVSTSAFQHQRRVRRDMG